MSFDVQEPSHVQQLLASKPKKDEFRVKQMLWKEELHFSATFQSVIKSFFI